MAVHFCINFVILIGILRLVIRRKVEILEENLLLMQQIYNFDLNKDKFE